MMSRYGKVVSRLDLWNIVLSTVVCGNCFAETDMILVFKIFYEVLRGGTRLAMSKTISAPDSSSLKPGSGATEESRIRGSSDSRTNMLTPDCWTMKIQD